MLVFRGQVGRGFPGDAGHAASFGYPVRYQIVDCGFMDLVEGSGETLAKLRQACKQLREEGIRGVVADCGLVSLYQRELGEELCLWAPHSVRSR